LKVHRRTLNTTNINSEGFLIFGVQKNIIFIRIWHLGQLITTHPSIILWQWVLARVLTKKKKKKRGYCHMLVMIKKKDFWVGTSKERIWTP
jgi:hypothetical protein